MREGFDCRVTAAFLDSGRTVAMASNVAAVVAGFAYWYQAPGPSAGILALSLICWAVESWFAVRVAVDRSLFLALAEEPGAPDRLDTLLVEWKLIKVARPRPLSDRSRGALRLWRLQSTALSLQLIMLAIAMTLRAVNL